MNAEEFFVYQIEKLRQAIKKTMEDVKISLKDPKDYKSPLIFIEFSLKLALDDYERDKKRESLEKDLKQK